MKIVRSILLFCHTLLLIPTGAHGFEWLARRTGEESCWAKFDISTKNSSNEALCVPHRLWVETYSKPQGISGLRSEKWQAFSPLELEPGHRKEVFYLQKTQGNILREPDGTLQEKTSALPLREAAAVHFRDLSFWTTPVESICIWMHEVWRAGLQALEKKREESSEWIRESGADRFGIFRQLLVNEPAPSGAMLRTLGFVHLLAATGIHLCALSAWIAFIIMTVIRFTPIPIRVALFLKRLFMGCAWLWCWLLSGGRTGMIRPLFLIAVQGLASRTGFRWKNGAALFLAIGADFLVGIGISIFSHRSIMEAVTDRARFFYLFAVSANVLFRSGKHRHLDLAVGSWILTSMFEVLTHPVVSLATALLSWITIPLFAGFIYPILVLRTLISFDVSPFLRASDWLIAQLAQASLYFHSVWIVPRISLLISLGLTSLIWLVPMKWRYSSIAGVSLICVGAALSKAQVGKNSSAIGYANRVEQLDVGQGDGALVTENTGGEPLAGFIDTGSAKALNENQWLELLARHGIFHVSWVAVTHLDEDHSGGIQRLSSVAAIDCATTSEAELNSPRGIRWKTALEVKGVRVTSQLENCIPYPALGPQVNPGKHQNNENMSAFLIPLLGGGFYLGAGDATEKDEPRIGEWASGTEKKLNLSQGPRILKISHHGSKTSSNPVFLKLIRPTEAWISDGIGNHYGHPSSVVIDRIRKMGIPIRRTDEEGTLESKATNSE